jgi:hypothetical protein
MSEPQYSPSNKKAPTSSTTEIPGLVASIVALCAFLMALGAVVALFNPAMLVAKGEEINGAVRVYAGYLFSRNLVIAAMLLGTLLIRARGALGNMMVLAALIQLLDAVLDGAEARWILVPGVLALGLALLFGAFRLARNPLWRIATWRDPR